MSALHLSPIGVQLICSFEGYRSMAYPDPVGIWTIGYGTTRIDGRPVHAGLTCTVEQAEMWLRHDVQIAERAVNAVAPPTILQCQFDACVSLTYNIGSGAFQQSTIARKLRAGQPNAVLESNFVAWNKLRNAEQMLVPSAGLTRRRRAEFHLFSTGNLRTQF